MSRRCYRACEEASETRRESVRVCQNGVEEHSVLKEQVSTERSQVRLEVVCSVNSGDFETISTWEVTVL